MRETHDDSLGKFRGLELRPWPIWPIWPISYFNSRSKRDSFFHIGSPSISTFHSCFLFGHLRCEHGLHSPFFQSPFKFIGFRKGPTVLLPLENRDQSIHYSDRDGCRSWRIVPITRTSKRGTPSFQHWPPQRSPHSPLIMPFSHSRFDIKPPTLVGLKPNYMAIPSTSLSLQNMRWRGVKDRVAINEGGIHLESLSYRLSIMRTSFRIGKSAAGLELITRRGNKDRGCRKALGRPTNHRLS